MLVIRGAYILGDFIRGAYIRGGGAYIRDFTVVIQILNSSHF